MLTAPPAPPLLRAARVAVVLSALAAPIVHAVLATHQPVMPWLTAAALVAGIAGGLVAPGLMLAALLAIAPVWQAVLGAITGDSDIQLVMPWLAAAAACLALDGPSRWRSGGAWAVAVAGWALVVALTWPVTVLRELDFTTFAFTGRGAGPAPSLAALVVLAAQAQLVGLLGFDWVVGASTQERARIWRWVGPGIAAACALAVWQAAVNPSLLSREPWIRLGRAAGAFYDANATGALAALLGPLLASRATAVAAPASWRPAIGWTLVSLAAVLASGSRTSMAAWAVCATVAWLWLARRSARTALLAVAVTAGVVVIASLLRTPGEGQFGAAARLAATARTMLTADGVANVLWYRDGYGPAAMAMIGEHPWAGVGPGAFGAVVGDYSPPALGFTLPADNAQNWWRHQWAELGLVGVLPGLLASLLAAGAALAAVRSATPAWALPLLALGLLSLVSPPVQHPLLQVLVGALVAGGVIAARRDGPAPRPPAPAWAAVVWLTAISCAAALAVDGWKTFRPAYRAARFQRLYTYGFSDEMPTPFGVGRWASTRAVAVFAPPIGSDLVVNIVLPHDDLAARPVRVVVSGRRGPLCVNEVRDQTMFWCRIPAEPEGWLLMQLEMSRASTTSNGFEQAAFVTAGLLPPLKPGR
jgi:hypothetical protein